MDPIIISADVRSDPDNTLEEVRVTATKIPEPLPNPLNAYESYTYCLSLHLLGQQEYNNIVNSQGTGYVPSNVLVSSAGRFGSTFNRNSEFAEDFYFDNFKMETIINVTTRSRSSNIIECSFTLIEPLGFTFINRLIAAANQLDRQASYIMMPYLLQIDFFGYQNGEYQPVPGFGISVNIGNTTSTNLGQELTNLRKSIPIRLIGIKTRVTSRGTEYSITAVPYNHEAFNQTNIVVPAAVKIQAKTVQQVFGTGNPLAAEGFSTSVTERQDLQKEIQQLSAANAAVTFGSGNDSRGGFGIANTQSQLNAAQNKLSALGDIQTSGLTDAINDWHKNLVIMKTVTYANKYYVKFHSDIGGAELYNYGPINSASATVATSTKNSTQAGQGASKGQIDFNTGTVSIAAGAKIDAIIDWAVRNSDYIASQLKDGVTPDNINPAADNSTILTGPLKWYKIVPKIQIREFDPKTNRYALDITLEVNPWLVSNKLGYAPQGRKPGEVKLYEWLYSGQNKDVLDMQIDFDMLYYNQLRAYTDKNKVVETAQGEKFTAINPDLDPNNQPIEPGYPGIYRSITKVPNTYISDDYRQTGRAGGDQSLSVKAGDLQKSLSHTARGDMINLNLKIIGDPHFIKQDDFFYNFNIDNETSALTPNGSLWMDGSELYVRVIFRSPLDYDDVTGLAIPNLSSNKYSYSEFSGIYKVIKVSSEFRQGKFEQTLEMALITIEEGISNLSYGSNPFEARRPDTSLQLQVRGFTSTRFSGPSILQTGLYAAGGAAASQLAGGQGSGGGLLNSIVNQVTQKVTGQITGAIGDKVKGYADQLFTKGKEFFGIGQNTGVLGTAGGADGAAAHEGASNVPDTTPAGSAMNDASAEWTPAPDTAPLVDGAGVDGAVGDAVELDGAVDFDAYENIDLGFDGGDIGGF